MLVGRRSAKGRHFDDFPPEAHVGKPESAPDEAAVPEQRLDFLRRRVRGHVEVLGLPLEQQVSYTATDEIRLVSRLIQCIEDLQRAAADVRPRYVVRGPRNDLRFADDTVLVLRTLGYRLE